MQQQDDMRRVPAGGVFAWRRLVRAAGLLGLGLVLAGRPVTGWSGEAPDPRRDDVVRAVEKVMPAVVNIATKTRVRQQGFFYDWWRDNWSPFFQELPPQTSAGSGVIVDEAGFVLTNSHVVEEADEILVTLTDGSEYEATLIKATRRTDVALLKLKVKEKHPFAAARFAPEEDLLLGETVLALGNPFGLGVSVSRGILSSKTRRASPGQERRLRIPDWLQTDAAINPGNSGGPLINLRGEVIGLNVAIYRPGQGIGFAIPIKQVSEALAEIYTPEELQGLWFGARMKPGSAPLEVSQVQAGSPADQAGLRVGDGVLAIDGEAPKSFIEATQLLLAAGDRQPVTLRIRREGQERQVKVRLAPEQTFFNAALIRQKLGVSLQPLTPELAESLGLSTAGGLVISGVDAGSPADKAGLRQGFVVKAIDGQPMRDLVQAAKLLYAKPAGDNVELNLMVESSSGFFIQRRTGNVTLRVR